MFLFTLSIITHGGEKVNEFIKTGGDFGIKERNIAVYCEKITNCTAFFLCF